MRSLAVCLSVQGGISARAAAYADELDTMRQDMLRTNRLSSDLVARARFLDQWVVQNKAELSPLAVTVRLQSYLRILLRMRAGIDAARKSELEDMSIYAVQYYGQIVVYEKTTHYDGQTRRSLCVTHEQMYLARMREHYRGYLNGKHWNWKELRALRDPPTLSSHPRTHDARRRTSLPAPRPSAMLRSTTLTVAPGPPRAQAAVGQLAISGRRLAAQRPPPP
jgi:hypothetical protein